MYFARATTLLKYIANHAHTFVPIIMSMRDAGVEELVSRDPQLPQSFVPTTRHMIWPGDRLTVTCDFDSTSR